MHDLKEGGRMLQHRPGTLPPILSHIKEEPPSAFFYAHSNPIDNAAAAAAAAAAAGLIDPHSRELHNALVATINNNVAAVNGTLTSAAVAAHTQQLKNHQQQQANTTAQQVAAAQQQQQQQQQQQKTAAAQQTQANLNMLNGSNTIVPNATNTSGSNNNNNSNNSSTTTLNGTTVKTPLSGRSTPNGNGSINGANAADPAPGKLFVGGLSWQTSSEKLKEYFNMFGTVTDVLIMKDPVTQRSRGFGFITFQEPNSVDKVLQVPIHTLDGKKIDPKHATPKNRPRQTNKTKKIFVGGVSQDTSADEVKAYFNQFGTVEETVMLMDQQTKRHRGFGFVTFENEDIVDRVCEIHFHTIKNKKVECKKAQPKEAVTPTNAATQLLQKRIMLSTLSMPLQTAPAAQLLGARAQLAGVPNTVNHQLAMLQTQQLQFQTPGAAAAAAAQQAALITHPNPFQVQNATAAAAAAMAANGGGFGKLLTGYPQAALHSLRYTPYPIPASALAVAQHQQHQHQQNAAAAHAAVAAQQQHQHQHQHQPHQPQATHSTTQTHATAAANPTAVAAAAASQAHNAALAVAGGNAAHAGVGGAATATGQHHPLTAAAVHQAALVASNPLQTAGNPYSGYALANVDMSSFQGVDWSSMYGMGMYV